MGLVLNKKSGNTAVPTSSASQKVGTEESLDEFVVPTAEEAEANRADEGGTSDFFQLVDGKNLLLILPTKKSWNIPKWPWRSTAVHQLWEEVEKLIGFEIPETIDRIQTCARAEGQPTCQWCQLATKLKNGKGSDASLAKALRENERCFANVVNIMNESKFVQPFRFGFGVAKSLKQALIDGETFCDPRALIPVRITKTGSGKATRYEAKVMVQAKSRGTLTKEWIDQMRDLNDFVSPPLTAAEAKASIDELFSIRSVADISSGSQIDDGDDSLDDDIPF